MKKKMVWLCAVLFLGTLFFADTARADRFINNHDGSVTDTQTDLMWADKDNGGDINWTGAKSHCQAYSAGGKTGWRMPTGDELGQLHTSGAYGSLIKKTGEYVWSSETRGANEAAIFYFIYGAKYWIPQEKSRKMRAIPVRAK